MEKSGGGLREPQEELIWGPWPLAHGPAWSHHHFDRWRRTLPAYRHCTSTDAPHRTLQGWRIHGTSYTLPMWSFVELRQCGALATGCSQPEGAHFHPKTSSERWPYAQHWSYPLLLGGGVSSNCLKLSGILGAPSPDYHWVLGLNPWCRQKIWQICPGQLCLIKGSELPAWGIWERHSSASRNSPILLVSVCTLVPYSRNGSCPSGHSFCTMSVCLLVSRVVTLQVTLLSQTTLNSLWENLGPNTTKLPQQFELWLFSLACSALGWT